MVYLVMHMGDTDECDTVEFVGSTEEKAQDYILEMRARVCTHEPAVHHGNYGNTVARCNQSKKNWARDLEIVVWEMDATDGRVGRVWV